MTATLLLAILLARSEPSAEGWFRTGLELRQDAIAARSAFLQAAQRINDESPASAHAKARALALAGMLPDAIRTLHAGLSRTPYDRELQYDLLALREMIAYPEPSDPRLRVRPDRFHALRHRVSPGELFLSAVVSGLLGAVALIRYLTRRSKSLLVIAIVGWLGFLGLFALSRWNAVEVPAPLVLGRPATLRAGNGSSYPARIDASLPAGVEVTELGRRGEWVHVELPGGAAGWLPESSFGN